MLDQSIHNTEFIRRNKWKIKTTHEGQLRERKEKKEEESTSEVRFKLLGKGFKKKEKK